MLALVLGDPPEIAAHDLEVPCRLDVVVVATRVEHVDKGAPLSFLGVVERAAADKR